MVYPENDIIVMKNVSYEYPTDDPSKRHMAVSDISLEIKRGSFVAVLGHNGSGKSTLAKLINGILVPTSGTVTVNGMDTADDDRLFDIRKSVGMVFQNPDNQLVATIVEEDVAFAPENLGISPPEIRKRVDAALETVGMTEYARHAPHMLSGGQKQRVAIAGILAMEPECIVFDESTAMLDPSGRAEIMKTIKKLNENGMTTVMITHYMEEAAQAERIIVMNDGKIAMDGDPRSVFSRPNDLEKMGLDVPQITEFVNRLASDPFVSYVSHGIPGGVTDINEAFSTVEGIFRECGVTRGAADTELREQ